MLKRFRHESLDVVGTRNAEGDSMGFFSSATASSSKSYTVCKAEASKSSSTFLASSEREVRFAEVGYAFGLRRRGESKLDVNTAVEYLFLILDLFTW